MSLQQTLKSLDGSAISIQRAASAMMKHYDQTAAVAVTEWRNALSTTTHSPHLMSLLYVANEVLQISKRNRGNKFLEAFSGILGQSLQHICRQDPSLVEKVRRTVKIWGDRRVFSGRFVHELLLGLDTFRNGGGPKPAAAAPKAPARAAASPKARAPAVSASSSGDDATSNLPSSTPTFQDDDNATFSPDHNNNNNDASKEAEQPQQQKDDDDNDDDIMEILNAPDKNDDDDDDDDDDDIFGSDTQLKVDIDLEQVGGTSTPTRPAMSKRRRSSATNNSSDGVGSGGKRRRRGSAIPGGAPAPLSTNSLLELSTTVAKLQEDFEESQRLLNRIDKNLARTTADELAQIVGDELQVEYRQIIRYQEQIANERRRLHGIAQERKGLEQQAVAYLPWLERQLEQDQADVAFCDRLERELETFVPIHGQLKAARDVRRSEEAKRLQEEAEQERVRREQEEAERFRQESMKRQTEQVDGMVWDPRTREYVTLDTNESWRD